jgi:hypothetical protein
VEDDLMPGARVRTPSGQIGIVIRDGPEGTLLVSPDDLPFLVPYDRIELEAAPTTPALPLRRAA